MKNTHLSSLTTNQLQTKNIMRNSAGTKKRNTHMGDGGSHDTQRQDVSSSETAFVPIAVKPVSNRTEASTETRGEEDSKMETRRPPPLDPSPDWVVKNLSTRAAENRKLIREITQSQSDSANRQTRQFYQSRQRQALLLMTGGGCNAELFLDKKTGKLKSPYRINIAVDDLAKSYRMDKTRFGAFMKRVLRTFEQHMQKGTSLYHAGVAIVALGVIIASLVGVSHTTATANNTVEQLKQKVGLVAHNNTKKHAVEPSSKVNIGIVGTMLAVSEISTSMQAARPLRTFFVHASHSLTTWRSAQLVNEVFQDGISKGKLDNIKKVSRDIVDLDHRIERARKGGDDGKGAVSELDDQHIKRKIEAYRKHYKPIYTTLTFGVVKNNHARIAALLDMAMRHQGKYTTTTFMKELISICGVSNVHGYHFLNCYGEPRQTVKEIIAAYLEADEKSRDSIKALKMKAFPDVASKSSIKSTLRMQNKARTTPSTFHTNHQDQHR